MSHQALFLLAQACCSQLGIGCPDKQLEPTFLALRLLDGMEASCLGAVLHEQQDEGCHCHSHCSRSPHAGPTSSGTPALLCMDMRCQLHQATSPDGPHARPFAAEHAIWVSNNSRIVAASVTAAHPSWTHMLMGASFCVATESRMIAAVTALPRTPRAHMPALQRGTSSPFKQQGKTAATALPFCLVSQGTQLPSQQHQQP